MVIFRVKVVTNFYFICYKKLRLYEPYFYACCPSHSAFNNSPAFCFSLFRPSRLASISASISSSVPSPPAHLPAFGSRVLLDCPLHFHFLSLHTYIASSTKHSYSPQC